LPFHPSILTRVKRLCSADLATPSRAALQRGSPSTLCILATPPTSTSTTNNTTKPPATPWSHSGARFRHFFRHHYVILNSF
jgi:hypothetical protein